jgi:CHAT domain
MKGRIRILFLAANPEDVEYKLRLDREFKAIADKIQRGPHRDSIELIAEWSIEPQNLIEVLLRHRPHVLHFSGHGQKGGFLTLEDSSGNASTLNPSVFARLLAELKDNIRLVLLNACYSKAQAQSLKETVDYAIGMKRPIFDETAKVFAATFYQALAFGHSVQKAFNLALIEPELQQLSGSDTPKLFVREGVDASESFLAEDEGAAGGDSSSSQGQKDELDYEGKKVKGKKVNLTNVDNDCKPGEQPFGGKASTRVKIDDLEAGEISIINRRNRNR